MNLTEDEVLMAWARAGGRCQCRRGVHGHQEECGRELFWEARGRDRGPGAWEAHCRGGAGDGENGESAACEILCWPCHRTAG